MKYEMAIDTCSLPYSSLYPSHSLETIVADLRKNADRIEAMAHEGWVLCDPDPADDDLAIVGTDDAELAAKYNLHPRTIVKDEMADPDTNLIEWATKFQPIDADLLGQPPARWFTNNIDGLNAYHIWSVIEASEEDDDGNETTEQWLAAGIRPSNSIAFIVTKEPWQIGQDDIFIGKWTIEIDEDEE